MLNRLSFFKAVDPYHKGVAENWVNVFYMDILEDLQETPQGWHNANNPGPKEHYLIRSIEGLNPTKSNIDITGDRESSRVSNILLDQRQVTVTLGFDPYYGKSVTEQRRDLYNYLMPGDLVRMVIYSSDVIPVYIEGVIESHESNTFTNEPLSQIVILCSNPYLLGLNTIVRTYGTNSIGVNTYFSRIPSEIFTNLCRSGAPSPVDIKYSAQKYMFVGVTGAAAGVYDYTGGYAVSNYPYPRITVRNIAVSEQDASTAMMDLQFNSLKGHRGFYIDGVPQHHKYGFTPEWLSVSRFTPSIWFRINRNTQPPESVVQSIRLTFTVYPRYAGL